jgi:hypothetical protein
MAKKNCEFGSEVSNGSKTGLVFFVIVAGANILRHLKGKPKKRARKRGDT